MNPHQRIESIKAYAPPESGDLFTHPEIGVVKLLKRSHGDSWIARKEVDDGKRFGVRPSKLRRFPGNEE